MKEKSEIIKDLEDQILPRLEEIKILQLEVDTLQKSVVALRELGEEKIPVIKKTVKENKLVNYPDYPLKGLLLDKYRYLEDITLRVWSKNEMENLIKEIEGDKSKVTLRSARQKTHYYINKGELIKLKYSNKNNYTFFTTRSEWVERYQDNGTTKFRLIPQHEPEQALLSSLTEEQRSTERISWSGIN